MRTQDVASSSEEDREANAGAEEWTIKNRVISKKLVYMAEKFLENPQYFFTEYSKDIKPQHQPYQSVCYKKAT